jgi:hypothetical protein
MEAFTHIYASKVIKGQPQNFTGVEINGVETTDDDIDGRAIVSMNNDNPEFYSAYVRHKDGRALAIADFGTHAEAAAYGAQLAARYEAHGWTFRDLMVETHV